MPKRKSTVNDDDAAKKLKLMNSLEVDKLASPLHKAAMMGEDTSVVAAIINKVDFEDRKAFIDMQDSNGQSALHLAVQNGFEETARVLLDNGIYINLKDLDFKTALHNACEADNVMMVRLLLEFKPDITLKDSDGKCAQEYTSNPFILELFEKYNVNAQALLKQAEADLAIQLQNDIQLDEDSLMNSISQLHMTAFKGCSHYIAYLIKEGSLVNALDEDIKTPLHIAVHQGNIGCVLELLYHKADPGLIDNQGNTALEVAISRKEFFDKIAMGLVEDDSYTKDEAAIKSKQLTVVQTLLKTFADKLKRKENLFITEIKALLQSGRLDELNKRRNEIIAYQSPNGGNIFHQLITELHPSQAIIAILNEPNLVNHTDKDGDSPLHLACKTNQEAWVEQLLKHGAIPHALNDQGEMPINLTTSLPIMKLFEGPAPAINADGFDTNLLCKTTGWHNNCGANCLSHFLAYKLETGELEQTFADDPEYLKLLKAFQVTYALPSTPTWVEVKALLKNPGLRTSALDIEAILSPVIRKYLEMIIIEKKELLWATEFCGALMDYVAGKPLDALYRPIVQSNNAKFSELKENYPKAMQAIQSEPLTDAEKAIALEVLVESSWTQDPDFLQVKAMLASEKAMIDDAEKASSKALREQRILSIKDKKRQELKTDKDLAKKLEIKIRQQRIYNLIDNIRDDVTEYMLEIGVQKYAAHMGNLTQSEMLSINHLGLITQGLKINLKVFRGANNNLYHSEHNDINHPWTMTLRNAHDIHWEYEHPNKGKMEAYQQTREHNAHYNWGAKGKFDIRGANPIEALISKEVQAYFNTHCPRAVVLYGFAQQRFNLRDDSRNDLTPATAPMVF